MLITFSGSTGAGKTTCAKYVACKLAQKGYPVVYLFFRRLTWKNLFKLPIRKIQFQWPHQPIQNTPNVKYFKNYFMKSDLQFVLAFLYYLYRIFLFRLILSRCHGYVVICDRYLFDSLFHFNLQSPLVQCGIYYLLRLLPRPTLAFLLTHELKELTRFRFQFDPEYLQLIVRNLNYFHQKIHRGILIQGKDVRQKAQFAWKVVENYLKNQKDGEV